MVFGVHNVFEWTSSTAKMELKAAKEGEKISSKSLNDDKNKHIFLIPSSIQFYLSHTHSLTRKHFTRLISFCGAFLLFSSNKRIYAFVRTHIAHQAKIHNDRKRQGFDATRTETKRKRKNQKIFCVIFVRMRHNERAARLGPCACAQPYFMCSKNIHF